MLAFPQEYVAKVRKHLEEKDPARAAVFKAKAGPAVKKVLDTFKDWQFFMGESMNPDGMHGLMNFKEDGCTPYMLFFKDGLIEEKVVCAILC